MFLIPKITCCKSAYHNMQLPMDITKKVKNNISVQPDEMIPNQLIQKMKRNEPEYYV